MYWAKKTQHSWSFFLRGRRGLGSFRWLGATPVSRYNHCSGPEIECGGYAAYLYAGSPEGALLRLRPLLCAPTLWYAGLRGPSQHYTEDLLAAQGMAEITLFIICINQYLPSESRLNCSYCLGRGRQRSFLIPLLSLPDCGL